MFARKLDSWAVEMIYCSMEDTEKHFCH